MTKKYLCNLYEIVRCRNSQQRNKVRMIPSISLEDKVLMRTNKLFPFKGYFISLYRSILGRYLGSVIVRLFVDIILASRKGRYSYKRRYEYQRRSVQQVQAVQRLKTGQEVIIFTPTKSTEEVIDLANRISDMFLSCGTYSPRFFENLDDIEKKFYVSFSAFLNTLISLRNQLIG